MTIAGMRTVLTSFFLAVALLACCRVPCEPCVPVPASAAPVERPVSVPVPVVDPAAAVYDAFIRSFLDGGADMPNYHKGQATELVFERVTAHTDGPFSGGKFREWDSIKAQVKGLRRETWEAFSRANARERDLEVRTGFAGHMEFLAKEQLDKQFESGIDEGWTRFHREHPGAAGILSMSSVGVSPDGRQALLYAEFSGGGLIGWGRYFLYELGTGSWQVVASQMTWIS